MGARVPVVLGSIAVFTLAIVAFVATNRGGACADCGGGSYPVDSAQRLDFARRSLDDKDYTRAIEWADSVVKVDPHNPESLGIREQAESALREIATSVASTREAMARGDSAQASTALDRVLVLDPKNPIVAELSIRLNANFSTRAAAARSEMEKARSLALARKRADQVAAFAEGETFSTIAGQSLADRQFALATQAFVQARDAYVRARRVIEHNEAMTARALPALIRNCSWNLEAQAWVDSDSNGVWDKQEEPLPGVQFRFRESGVGVSDNRGIARLSALFMGCEAPDVAVSALPPPSYEPTTKQPLLVRGVGDAGEARFGFRHVR